RPLAALPWPRGGQLAQKILLEVRYRRCRPAPRSSCPPRAAPYKTPTGPGCQARKCPPLANVVALRYCGRNPVRAARGERMAVADRVSQPAVEERRAALRFL